MPATIKTLVSSSADIIQIVSLKTQDTYKRLYKQYGSSDPELRYGVVTDVLHNGENAAITVLEFSKAYDGSVNLESKVFSTDQTLELFPARPDELRSYFQDLVTSAERDLQKKEMEVLQKRDNLSQAKALLLDETRMLTYPDVVTGSVLEAAEAVGE